MNRLQGWLQVVSNLGIIAGLVLVALQMRQESDIADAQLTSEYFLNTAEAFGSVSGEDVPSAWARAQMNAPDLSDAELSAVRYYLTRQWLLSMRAGALSESGLQGSPESAAFVEGWINTLGNGTAQRWWIAEHDRVLTFVPALRDAADARLREVGPAQRTAHQRLLEQMRTGPLPETAVQP